MNELIKIITNEQGQKLVSAKELHEFLGVKSKFADWIKNRINKYGFIENVDFATLSKNLENGGKEKDYIITIDMSKELSMVENNDKGREARRYFIECEKRLNNPVQAYLDMSEEDRAIAYFTEMKHNKLLKATIKEQEPLVDLARKRLDKNGLISITDVTKTLELQRGVITKWAKENGYLHKCRTEVNHKGTEYFRVYYANNYKCIGVTEKGLTLIHEIFSNKDVA
ncbi:antA/AntB antirepressor family protein [uncultured Clostridium sp.]|uniref:antA/AntB antirepressor family protein n=1 Tax=uncultured Clostridium sp. TaxID=59620 RepID=UPI0025EAF811|nr:antA/AntB antirepressor family protein [uncultured Clostridium sp.]